MRTQAAATLELHATTLDDASQLRSPEAVAFYGICLYVLSQTYLVPLWAIGPSWAVWPSLTDLCVLLLATCIPFLRRTDTSAAMPLAGLRRTYLFVGLLAVLSYALLACNVVELRPAGSLGGKGVSAGAYQLYRLVQFGIVLHVLSRLELNHFRRNIFRHVTGITLVLTSAGIVADYFGLMRTSQMAPHLSRDFAVAGPWAFYSRGVIGRAVGTISYHHAYPPVQVMLLAGLYLHLSRQPRVIVEFLVLAITALSCFLTGSRMGLIVVFLFAALVYMRRPKCFAFALGMCAVMMTVSAVAETDFSPFQSAIQRQSTIPSSYETDGLAGRIQIWDERISMLNQHPWTWLIGTGFGAASESGPNGHLLFLHIIVECGLAGLFLFLILLVRVLKALWVVEPGSKPLFCVTAALIVSGLTQETFYPVPAFGHFLGLYLLSLAVALREPCPPQ